MKKIIIFATIFSFLLTGCGKEEPDSVPVSDTPVPASTQNAPSEQKNVELEDPWYDTYEETESTPKVQLETAEKEETEEVEFTSREQNAANSLPYFFKNIKMERRNKKDYVIAEPDVETVGELFETNYDKSLRDVAKIASSTNSDELLQIVATIMPKTASTSSYLDYFFLACTLYERSLHGVSYIERLDGEDKFIGYDNDKHKIEVTISTGDFKYANAGMLMDDELRIQIAQKLYDATGIMLPDVADEIEQRIADEEAEAMKTESEEIEEVAEETPEAPEVPVVEETEKGRLLAMILEQQQSQPVASAAYKSFTDKVGAYGSYTKEEWTYLQSIWAWTGHDIDNFVMDHTHAELRNLLNSR